MKLLRLAAITLAAAVFAGAAFAQTAASPTSETAIEAANRKVVVDFYELAFNLHRPTEAARLYIGDRYIQHNPQVPNGAAAFYGYFEDFFREHRSRMW